MRDKIAGVFKDNPVMSSILTLTFFVGTIMAGVTSVSELDALVMTEKEHTADISKLTTTVKEIIAWNKCDRVERRLEALEDRKWKLEQVDASQDVIRQADYDISRVRREFAALRCAEVLTK